MKIGVGIDAVEVEKCKEWANKSDQFLKRIFSAHEIAYCRKTTRLCAQRFAARFAAREALFKALASAGIDHKMPFLRFCKLIEIIGSDKQPPTVSLSPEFLKKTNKKIDSIALSLTHIPLVAIASVVVVVKGE